MESKEELLTQLTDVYTRWEEKLASLTEDEIITRHLPSNLSIKDVIGHLRAWQQRSIARLEAALNGKEPLYPAWSAGMTPSSEDNVDRYNAIIHEAYLHQPWSKVHAEWSEGFLRFLELAKAIDEDALFEMGRYSWLPEYPLAAVLKGSLEHHEEHLETPPLV
jgi:hypothetical protein